MNTQKDFTHGGNIYEIQKQFSIEKEKILDFSANINPLGISPMVKEAIINSIPFQQHYPDPDYTELRESISEYIKVNPDDVVVGNGATEIIYLFFRSLQPRRMLIPVPTFSEYERAARLSHSRIRYFPLKEENDFHINAAQLIKNLADVDALVLCNPNNPTGQVVAEEQLMEVLNFCESQDIWVLLDEAFIEFVDEASKITGINLIGKFKNLLVVRAFTKFFGMPGIRLGYGVTKNYQLIKKIKAFKEPWSVNGLASAAGVAALKDKAYINKTREIIKREREYLFRELSQIKWLNPIQTYTNFILIKILDEQITSTGLRQSLIPYGVLIRDASNFINLNEKFVRVAVKDRESNTRLISVLKDYRREGI